MHRQGDRGNGEPPARDEPRPSGVTLRQILIVVAAALLVAFAAANFRRVTVSFLLFTTQARVVTVIVVAGLLGFVAGYFAGRPSREERRRLREPDRRD